MANLLSDEKRSTSINTALGEPYQTIRAEPLDMRKRMRANFDLFFHGRVCIFFPTIRNLVALVCQSITCHNRSWPKSSATGKSSNCTLFSASSGRSRRRSLNRCFWLCPFWPKSLVQSQLTSKYQHGIKHLKSIYPISN